MVVVHQVRLYPAIICPDCNQDHSLLFQHPKVMFADIVLCPHPNAKEFGFCFSFLHRWVQQKEELPVKLPVRFTLNLIYFTNCCQTVVASYHLVEAAAESHCCFQVFPVGLM